LQHEKLIPFIRSKLQKDNQLIKKNALSKSWIENRCLWCLVSFLF